jgi:hypothetical protein
MLKYVSFMLKTYKTKGIYMNFFKLSLITASLLLIGCGSDSKNDNTPQATNISDATNNMKALSAIGNLSEINLNTSTSKMQKLSKNQTFSCSKGGSLSMDNSEDGTATIMVMDKCTEVDSYMDGNLKIIEQDNGYYKMEMSNVTIKNNGETTSAKKLIIEGNDNEYWSKIDGDMSFVSQCFTGEFNIKTLEKIYEMQDGSDGVEKGKIELNGATYTFNYPNVTIKAGSENKTMLQSELDKEMESSTRCKISR